MGIWFRKYYMDIKVLRRNNSQLSYHCAYATTKNSWTNITAHYSISLCCQEITVWLTFVFVLFQLFSIHFKFILLFLIIKYHLWKGLYFCKERESILEIMKVSLKVEQWDFWTMKELNKVTAFSRISSFHITQILSL